MAYRWRYKTLSDVPWQLHTRYFEYKTYVSEKQSDIIDMAMMIAVMFLQDNEAKDWYRAFTDISLTAVGAINSAIRPISVAIGAITHMVYVVFKLPQKKKSLQPSL